VDNRDGLWINVRTIGGSGWERWGGFSTALQLCVDWHNAVVEIDGQRSSSAGEMWMGRPDSVRSGFGGAARRFGVIPTIHSPYVNHVRSLSLLE